ncbi:hypothetical protein [Streptomyces sp. NBC_01335]|uniref:hypothetical protein n=1 Tax=Streptomyces sp. NBC_01335 TaxID=2903828 RepID=UPI003FA3BF61
MGKGSVSTGERRLLPRRILCFNGPMAGLQYTSSGRSDLEPFWPSRQHHDFDRVCCRARNAQAL